MPTEFMSRTPLTEEFRYFSTSRKLNSQVIPNFNDHRHNELLHVRGRIGRGNLSEESEITELVPNEVMNLAPGLPRNFTRNDTFMLIMVQPHLRAGWHMVHHAP